MKTPDENSYQLDQGSKLSMEERKKLDDWEASYELAKIAQQEKTDLSILSREEYADFAIKHCLAIGAIQLRAAVWLRMATSQEEMNSAVENEKGKIKKEAILEFLKFSSEITRRAERVDCIIEENIEILQGTQAQGN